ncbi:MAG: hypothetical protein LBE38_07295 [Deltaproteobacteria bacterium]|nr:hypothetical protein [Deltaproteobacteria bacterium]
MNQNDNPFILWQRIEELLAGQNPVANWLNILPPILLDWSSLSWAFLTEMYPGVSNNYFIRGFAPDIGEIKSANNQEDGLAGWVHGHLNPLFKDSLNTGENLTHIFYQGEPIKKPTSFYGWPLIYYGKAIGGLFLVGTKGQTLTQGQKIFFTALASRLSAHAHHVRLHDWVDELKGIDFQTGLPHRANFLDRLDRLMSIMSIKHQRLCLKVFCISGLGRYSLSHKPQDTQELLRNVSNQLLQYASENWDMGHISYGVFTIAVPENNLEELNKCLTLIKKSLNDWSTVGRAPTQANFIFHESELFFPDDGDKPALLLEKALAAIAESL